MVSNHAVTVFYSYAHEDEHYRDELAKHLRILERQKIIRSWHDREISAGEDWRHEIDHHLRVADIVLLLVSPDFVASDYCYDVEMALALRRHSLGECVVIPIFLRPIDVSGAPFVAIQGLPKDARPVTMWPDPDAAFLEIGQGIRRAALAVQRGDGPPVHAVAGETEATRQYAAAARGRDVARIAAYRRLFDRPAFSMPCIFEHALQEVNHACNQITLALQTGTAYGAVGRAESQALYDVPGIYELETEPFVSTVTRIRNLVSNLRRSVDLLREHFRQLAPPGEDLDLEGYRAVFDMEFFILSLIRRGVSKDFVRRAFALMDTVDSERNAVIELMNGLLEIGNLPQLAKIPLSTEQLRLSEQMRPYSWDKYYIQSHAQLRDFLSDEADEGSESTGSPV